MSDAIGQKQQAEVPLIPAPVKLVSGKGYFSITSASVIHYTDELNASDIEVFNSFLYKNYGFKLKLKQSEHGSGTGINVRRSKALAPDAYKLEIDSNGIRIEGGEEAGVFYALQTLIQILPPVKVSNLAVPFVQIEDSPRFGYRGMHLDVSRHFFSVSQVKKYIDYLALYKFNTFHWHLTDDQGWRIEIKKYPLLQEKSAWRNGTLVGHYHDKPARYDSIFYGGFYSQKEVKEIIEYASDRRISIVPEIEMPGHAKAALAAYPELSCTGGPFEVGKTWGVYKDVFCSKEETFVFLQNVLEEVCALFPGKFIHIGGDECPKDRWKECKSCRERIVKENLSGEKDLQRYFTNRITNYLKSKGKTAVGWDEILEEGLDSSAVVMSWRGYNGAVKAASSGHQVIMSPESYCYFDYYQSRNTSGKIAIGGYLPLERVYNFEPIPDVLTTEQQKFILGAQANVWTEYITDENRLQEMIYPRICALSEVLWSQKEKRNYHDFVRRLVYHFKTLSFLNISYSKALYDISFNVYPNGDNGIQVELYSGYPGGKIQFTLDDTKPSSNSVVYTEKIPIDQSVGLHASIFEGGRQKGDVFSKEFNINMATGKEIMLTNLPHPEYSKGGGFSLVNGVTGGLPWIPLEWLGFSGSDFEAVINLGQTVQIRRVFVDVLKEEAGKIFLPVSVNVYTSENGIDFKLAGSIDSSAIERMSRKLTIAFQPVKTKYVKIVAKNSNGRDWLFVDEVGVE
jgi:hexosaminidase